eukprot:1852494-Pleurochrysis_carterae.AAC.2
MRRAAPTRTDAHRRAGTHTHARIGPRGQARRRRREEVTKQARLGQTWHSSARQCSNSGNATQQVDKIGIPTYRLSAQFGRARVARQG